MNSSRYLWIDNGLSPLLAISMETMIPHYLPRWCFHSRPPLLPASFSSSTMVSQGHTLGVQAGWEIKGKSRAKRIHFVMIYSTWRSFQVRGSTTSQCAWRARCGPAFAYEAPCDAPPSAGSSSRYTCVFLKSAHACFAACHDITYHRKQWVATVAPPYELHHAKNDEKKGTIKMMIAWREV